MHKDSKYRMEITADITIRKLFQKGDFVKLHVTSEG